MVMLCSQIQLVERRQSVPRETSSCGIVQRLCAIQNVSNTMVKDDEDTHPGEDRPRSRVRSCRLVKSELPLQIASLRMQPGIKTLAPIDIRRDPRKPPSFCQHYKQIKRMRSVDNTDIGLMIRGTEISHDHARHEPSTNISETCEEDEDTKLDIELTECCHCLDNNRHMLDRLNIEQILRDECQVMIYDNFEEQGDESQLEGAADEVKEIEEPSPRTLQVISVKLNSRILEEEDLNSS